MSDTTSHHSVSGWLTAIGNAEGQADTAWRGLWERYAPAMTALARRHLVGSRKPLADEEDVVSQAFEELFRGMQQGRFAQLANRDDLQQILIMLVRRRVIDAARRNGFRAVHEAGESALPLPACGADGNRPLNHVPADAFPPDAAVLARDEFERPLASLENDTLRLVAVRRMFSASSEDIAAELDLSVRSVQRKLRLIAHRWRQLAGREQLAPDDLRQGFACWSQTVDPEIGLR